MNAVNTVMRAPNPAAAPLVRGRDRSRELARRFGSELRIARASAGMTQRRLGRLAGCTQQEVSRAERGATNVSLDLRCRLVAAAGAELGWRLYPTSTIRLRDSGQLELARAIASVVPASARVSMEVPVGPGDLRAADLLIARHEDVIHVEVERSLVDLQAQLRSAQVKREVLQQHHDRPVRLVLALPDTRRTRAIVAQHRSILEKALPAVSRAVWRALRDDRPLGCDGLLLVKP